jgi:hypothetical protein
VPYHAAKPTIVRGVFYGAEAVFLHLHHEGLRLKTLSLLMLVTPRDAVIANSGIRSLRSIKNVDFELAIYPNSLTKEQEEYYLPRWRRWPFVRILEGSYAYRHADAETIKENGLWGPYELGWRLWDAELPKLDGRYVGTIDADFEVLNSRFIPYMLNEMDRDERIIGYSSDSSPRNIVFDTYSQQYIRLNERNHTWFCIYRREAFTMSRVSQKYFECRAPEMLTPHNISRDAWDDAGWFQKDLKEKGYLFKSLPASFSGDYIHYGAFSNNVKISWANVGLYRIACKVARKYRFGLGSLIAFYVDRDRHRYHRTPKIK